MPRRRRLIDAFHETERRLRQILREFPHPLIEQAWRLIVDEIAAYRGSLLKRLLRERPPRAKATRECVIGPRLHRMALSILRKEVAPNAHAAAVREVQLHGRGEHARTEAAVDTLHRMMKAQWRGRLADARMALEVEHRAQEMLRSRWYHRWLAASRRRQVPRASASRPPRSP